MSKFRYELKIGEHNGDVHVDISVDIKHGLTNEDYKTVREALNIIEETARKYESDELPGNEPTAV